MEIKLNDWQRKVLEEMPDKVIVDSRRWAGKRNYYKALEKLKARKDGDL